VSLTEKAILQTLHDLESAVRSMRTSTSKPDLLPIFTRLDELTRQLPSETDRALVHYLQRKSYEKARVWLEERQPGFGTRLDPDHRKD
jgi:hypothetical protein